jgi:hypothetical protein
VADIVLTPYLTDYKSAKAVKEAWEADKDFVIQTFGHPGEGKPTNKSNMRRLKDPARTANIRYAKLRKVVVVEV